MTNFLDLARELRDTIYTHALSTEHILFAKNEIYPDFEYDRIDFPITVALLQVNKQVNAEAVQVFYARNTFQASLNHALGKPSLFTTHARLFRKIIMKLRRSNPDRYPWNKDRVPKEGEGATSEDHEDDKLIALWKQQTQVLVPMTNLRYLELNVFNLLIMICIHTRRFMEVKKENAATWTLLRELLKSLPQGVRKKEGLEHCGIWITGIFLGEDRMEMHGLGEAGRDIGLNYMAVQGGRCAIVPSYGAALTSASVKIERHYYG